jgi:sugar/nucleoside kinase (ribokinase family)
VAFSAEGRAIEQCVLYKNPKISTGAGDHFNAAYSYASLAGLPAAEKLRFANAYSGAYIAKGASPGLEDIANS